MAIRDGQAQASLISVSFDYVLALRDNPLARAVKIADLRHNSDATRLDVVTAADKERLRRYERALALLQE